MNNEKYKQYIETMSLIQDKENELGNLNRLLKDSESELREQCTTGSYGLEITAHAEKNLLERLEGLALENPAIYKSVMNHDRPLESIIWPSQLKLFIFNFISLASEKNEFSIESSKNGSGQEYHYRMEIKDWSGESKKLFCTIIVENFKVKTGYFNWE